MIWRTKALTLMGSLKSERVNTLSFSFTSSYLFKFKTIYYGQENIVRT
jgi:hypothetical protein